MAHPTLHSPLPLKKKTKGLGNLKSFSGKAYNILCDCIHCSTYMPET